MRHVSCLFLYTFSEVLHMSSELLRQIPKTDLMLSRSALLEAGEKYSRALVKAAVQSELDALRAAVMSGKLTAMPDVEAIERAVLANLEHGGLFSLKRVINATGVVLHTNLGRAPLGEGAAEHVAAVAKGYCNLEYDLGAGKRGSRYAHVEKLLCELTGAEAAMVVNNNAGAVFLALNTLAKGRGVAVSRGELVEIGGSFRVPEIMRASGAELLEVGTTNKTHPSDYITAMDEYGAEMLLKVHTSNFVMVGFTEEVSVRELSQIAHERGGIVMHDLGSGFMFPPEAMGLHDGHAVWSSLRDGADIVCFSADKLLGTAQGGVIIGKREYIERIKKNQLTRMLRIDKLSLAALEICLQYCRDPQLALDKLPTLRMLSMTSDECRERAEALRDAIAVRVPGCDAHITEVGDEAGGGSLPGVTLPGWAVAVDFPGLNVEEAEARLRSRSVPIIARVNRDGVLFSVRTLFERDVEEIAAAVKELWGK